VYLCRALAPLGLPAVALGARHKYTALESHRLERVVLNPARHGLEGDADFSSDFPARHKS
jgi:hypothetical protein